MIHLGDCIEVMRGMEAESVDAVVTDPPYGLEFMGKGWDKFGAEVVDAVAQGGFQDGNGGNPFSRSRVRFGAGTPFQAWCEAWGREALRVTKPGGYLLAFGGTRTHHRLVCGLEDAGWIIRDELTWVYASGFPKGKANLKPAHEPIVLARKPGPLRPLGIDAARITWAGPDDAAAAAVGFSKTMAAGRGAEQVSFPTNYDKPPYEPDKMTGRWPSNVLLDPDSAELFDEPNPEVVGSGATARSSGEYEAVIRGERSGPASIPLDNGPQYGDTGGYSRFFLIPKSSRSDREPVVRGQLAAFGELAFDDFNRNVGNTVGKRRENAHPTVKPVDLMRHLIRLVTPTGGTVLDCFAGSGSTLIAAELEGFPWIGIEKEPEYVAIAEARLNGTQRGLGLDVGAPTSSYRPPKKMPPWPEEWIKENQHKIDNLFWNRPDDDEPEAA